MALLKHLFKTTKQRITNYWYEMTAVTAVVFALVVPVLIGAGGIGVDITQTFLVKNRLCNALDAAVLAAAGSSGTEAELEERMRAYMIANYPNNELGQFVDILPAFTEDRISAKAKAEIDAAFTRTFGYDTLQVSCESEVEKNVRGLEIALVLDVTGSMKGSKIEALRNATRKFIEVVYDKVEDPEDARIALVPYSATVNVGSIAPDIVVDQIPGGTLNPIADTPGLPSRAGVIYDADDPEQWRGCVMARDGGFDQTDDDQFTGGLWDAFWYEHTDNLVDNHWDDDVAATASLNVPFDKCNNRRSPNLVCPVENPIVPLTSNETLLDTAAADIKYWCRGGTLGNLGMVWGWRVLSPTPPFEQGAEYDDDLWQKVILQMTDGQNQLYGKPGIDFTVDFSAYGRLEEGRLNGATTKSAGLAEVNSRFAEICEDIKEEGIIIYTITFGSGVNSATKNLYESCATDSKKYKDAPSNADLIQVYEEIAEELSNLHLTR